MGSYKGDERLTYRNDRARAVPGRLTTASGVRTMTTRRKLLQPVGAGSAALVAHSSVGSAGGDSTKRVLEVKAATNARRSMTRQSLEAVEVRMATRAVRRSPLIKMVKRS